MEPAARARRATIGDALRGVARKLGPTPALRFGERAWSFADLDRAADRIGRALLASGLAPGDRVAAFGRNSDAYLLLWLGCARAGLVHVPANYALTATELGYILGQSGAAALFHDAALAAVATAAAPAGLPIRLLADLLTLGDDDSPLEIAATEADLVQIIYTSGTTGAPKGAMMTHRAYLTEYLGAALALDFAATDRVLAALPLYHTAQLHCFLMPQLLLGAHNTLLEAPDPATVLAVIEAERITAFFAPPTVWIALLRHPDFDRRDLASLQRVYYGAAIMPVPVLHELRARLPNAQPYNCYGQSEIAPLATVLRPEEHAARPASVGRPLPTVETRIVDAEMRDVAPGERGEIIHRSAQLMTGYWGKPEETAEAFAGGWFHSGDVGTMDAEGFITIVDRTKDVINTGGVLVASREVEDALLTHPAVSECAVIGLPDPRWIEAVTAVVVFRPGQDADEATLIAHARAMLAPYKLPKRVIVADTLPRNTAGKLLKRELRAVHGGQRDALPGA